MLCVVRREEKEKKEERESKERRRLTHSRSSDKPTIDHPALLRADEKRSIKEMNMDLFGAET